jgi:iron-sulfur cluster assembly protein
MTVSPINFTFEDEVAVPQSGTVVTITDRAADKAKNLLETRGLSAGALRVFVVGGGCSGYQYGMALAQEEEEGDLVIEQSGVRILVDADSAPLLHGAEIDYVDDLMKSGFTIFNPNAVKSCACGSSFQTADASGQARACH